MSLIYNNKETLLTEIEAFRTLSDHHQWVGFKLEDKPGTTKKDKVPYQLLMPGSMASITEPGQWGSFDDAVKFKDIGLDGLGFVLTDNDPFTFIDLDNCRNPETGEIDEWAQQSIRLLNSYTETSISGTGLHILIKGTVPGSRRRKGNVEVYSSKRYFALTGHHLAGTPTTIEERDDALKTFYQSHFAPDLSIVESNTPRATLSDEEIINLASAAKNGQKFQELFQGTTSLHTSDSEAVLSLLCILAFYSRDKSQLARLFQRSKLHSGEWISKWARRKEQEIEKALSLVSEQYGLASQQNRQDHNGKLLELTEKCIASYGDDNLLYTQSTFWVWEETVGYWQSLDDREIKKKAMFVLENSSRECTRTSVETILDFMKSRLHKQSHNFDIPSEAVNCISGELRHINGSWEIHEHNKTAYPTSCIPVEYDPEAKAPRYEKYKAEIFAGDPDCQEKSELLDEILGYCLLRTAKFEKFFILLGEGENGKSVFLELISKLLGAKNVSAVAPTRFGDRFQRGHLAGKFANVVTEVSAGEVLPDAELKAIVSGEMLTAEHKQKNPFDFKPFATIVFGANQLPHCRDLTHAMLRRLIILQFNNRFEGSCRDNDLKEKLAAEISGILNCALSGAARLLKRDGFTEVVSSRLAKSAWRSDIDQIAQFIEEECEIDSSASTSIADAYEAYQMWALRSGIRLVVNKRTFVNRMCKEKGIRKTRTGNARMLSGIRVVH